MKNSIKILLVIVVMVISAYGCNNLNNSSAKAFTKQDTIETQKKIYFANNKSNKLNFLDSILNAYKDRADQLFHPDSLDSDLMSQNVQPEEINIVPFYYKVTPHLLSMIKNDNNYPHWFKENLKRHLPIYLYIKKWKTAWKGGNRFQDGGLSREQVGVTYDYGNYPNEQGYIYSLNFLYVDKNDGLDADFGESSISTSNPYFGMVEIGRTNRNGDLGKEFTTLALVLQSHYGKKYATPFGDPSYRDSHTSYDWDGDIIYTLFKDNNKYGNIADLLANKKYLIFQNKIQSFDNSQKCFSSIGLKYTTIIKINFITSEIVKGFVQDIDGGSGLTIDSVEFTGAKNDNKINVNFKGKKPIVGDNSEWTNSPWTINGKGILNIKFLAKNYDTNKWGNFNYEFLPCK